MNLIGNQNIDIEDQLNEHSKPILVMKENQESLLMLVESNDTKGTMQSEAKIISPMQANRLNSQNMVGMGVSNQPRSIHQRGRNQKQMQLSYQGLHHINKQVQRPVRTLEVMTNRRAAVSQYRHQKTPTLLTGQKYGGLSSVNSKKNRGSNDYESLNYTDHQVINMPSGYDIGKNKSRVDKKFATLVQIQNRDDQETRLTTEFNSHSRVNAMNLQSSAAQYSFQNLQQPPTIIQSMQRPQSQNHYTGTRIKPSNLTYKSKVPQDWSLANSPLGSQVGAYQIVQSGQILQTNQINQQSMEIGGHQKRLKTAQGGQRVNLMNQNQSKLTNHEQIFSTMEPVALNSSKLYSDKSKFMNKGLVYGQYSNSILSNQKKQFLNKMKKHMTSFGGMTKQDRVQDFNPDYSMSVGNLQYDQHQRFKTNSLHGSNEELEIDVYPQQSKPKIFYPSQFEPNKVCNQDRTGVMGRELPSKMVEQNQLAIREKQQNNILTRIFSKTHSYKHDSDNYSDGIVVPQSFLNTLDHKTQAKLLKIQRKDPSLPYKKECLLVNICAVKTHFTVDKNTLNAQHDENSLSKQMTEHKIENNGSILVHIAKLTPTPKITSASGGKIDDDSITMPKWMFQHLNIKVGDQICVTLDLMQVQKSINSQLKDGQYCIKRLIVEPLQQNYIELAMGHQAPDPNVKIITNAPEKSIESVANTHQSGDGERISTKDSFEKSFGRNEDIIVERIRQNAFRFRVLKLGSVMKFFANQKVYEFQVDQINECNHHSSEEEKLPFYTNFSDDKIVVELQIGDFQASEKSSEKGKDDSNSRSGAGTRSRKKKNLQKNDKNDGLDLDLIFEERGLDIYYMEKLIEQQQETREAAKKLQQKSTHKSSKNNTSSIKKQQTNISKTSKKFNEKSMKRSSIGSGSLSSKLSVSSPSGQKGQQSNTKSMQPIKNRKVSVGETQTSIQSNKSIKPENCPPQFLNANLNAAKTYNTGFSIQNSQNSMAYDPLKMNSRNSIPNQGNQDLNAGNSLNPNNEIIQIVIPFDDEDTHKIIERHASSGEDPITADVLMNEFKDFDKDKDQSIRQTDSKPTSKMVNEQDRVQASKTFNFQTDDEQSQEQEAQKIKNLQFSKKMLTMNYEKKQSQKVTSMKYSQFFLDKQKTLDFHTSFIKNIKSLKEGGLLGETNKSLIDQNNVRSPNGKKVGQKSPRLNHLLTGQTQQAQTLNLVLQGSSEGFQSIPIIAANNSSSIQKISGAEDKLKEFEYDLVNQKFIDAYKDNLGLIDPNDPEQQSPLIKESINFEQIQESRLEGRNSDESKGMQSKYMKHRGGDNNQDFQPIKSSQNIIQEPSSAVFPRVDSNTVSPDPRDLVQMKAPSKIVVSNFYMGSAQIQGDQSALGPPRSPIVTKLRRVPVRQDTEPINGLIGDPSTLKQTRNKLPEQQSPVQIIKFQNQANSEAFSEAKFTSYAENETIRMTTKAKDQVVPSKKSYHGQKVGKQTKSSNEKDRVGSELDHLILNNEHINDPDESYRPEEFGNIRYGQVSIITSEGAHEFSNVDLKEFKEVNKKVSQENSKQTSIHDICEQEKAAYFAQNMTNMLMRLAVRNNDLLKYDESTLQTVHQARVGVENSLHNYQGGPGQDLTPFLKQHMKDKDAFNRAHSKFNTDIFRQTLQENQKARNPTVTKKETGKIKKDKYGIKTYPKKPNAPIVDEELDMMPDVMTAIPFNKEASQDKQNTENQQFIQKFQEFHMQMMQLREAQKIRQRESGVTTSADLNENEDPYYQEFYSILELAAQNDNGTQYLQKLEEFIQKQVQDEWLANHLQETGSGDMSPIFSKALDLQKQHMSNNNRKIVDLQKYNNLTSSAEYHYDMNLKIGKMNKPTISPFNLKYSSKNKNESSPQQLLSDSQKNLLNQLTQQAKSPIRIPQSSTLRNINVKNNDTDPMYQANDSPAQNFQNLQSPASLRHALEDSVGTRLSNTPDYSIRDQDGSKTIEMRQAMQSHDNERAPGSYLVSLAKKESSGVSDMRSPHNIGSNLGSKENSKSRDKFSPGNSQNLDMTHIITASHPKSSKYDKQKTQNNLMVSTSNHVNMVNADLSTALKQETEHLKIQKLKKSPSLSPRKEEYEQIKKGTINQSMPDDQPMLGTASFDVMNPQTISIQQHQQATGTSIDNQSKQLPEISISNRDQEKLRQSSPLPSSVEYGQVSPTSSPLKNYDNIDVKFNVVPAGPQSPQYDKSNTNIQTVRGDDLTGQKVLNDIKSFRSKNVLTPIHQKQTIRQKNQAKLNSQQANHPKSHKEAGWAIVDQKKVIDIQNQNKEKLIQKSKTENGDVIQQFYPIRQKPGKQPLVGGEATDVGKLPSTYTVSQPLGATINNIGSGDDISVSQIPAVVLQGASSQQFNNASKTVTSMDESKSNVQVERNPTIKFDTQKDFRSKSRKKELKLFKEQIPADQAEHSASIPQQKYVPSASQSQQKTNHKNKQEQKNMNLNSREEDVSKNISYYEKKQKNFGNKGMKEYSTLNPMGQFMDIGTLSPNFIVTSMIGSRKQSAGYRQNVKKKLTNKGVSGGNILSTSKSRISQYHFSPKSALSEVDKNRVSRSQNRDVELIIRQYSESRIKIQNMSNEELKSPHINNTNHINSINATSQSQVNPRARSHARQATFSGDSRQIIHTNIGGSHQLSNVNRGSRFKKGIVDQNNINFVDYQHIVSDDQENQLSREPVGSQQIIIGRNFSTSPDAKIDLEDPGTVTGISHPKKIQFQSQNTNQGNFQQILQTANRAQRRAVSGISRKSGISGASAQSRGSRSRDDEKLSPTGMIFVKSSKLNFVKEVGGEGNMNGESSRPNSKNSLQIPSKQQFQ